MKKYLGAVGILFSVVLIGMVLTSGAVRAFPLVGARLLGQGKGLLEGFHEASAFGQWALPRLAVYVADFLVVLLVALGLLFIHLLVMVPIHLHRMQRQLNKLEDQVSLLRLELFAQVNGLLGGATPDTASRRALAEGGIIARPSRTPRAAA